MEQFVYIEYEDRELECIVEYVLIDEGDYEAACMVKEVINVFLPDGLQHLDKKTLGEIKVLACEEFHNSY